MKGFAPTFCGLY